MNLQVLHCPKCGAMQPNQERCGACGAKLPLDKGTFGSTGGASGRGARVGTVGGGNALSGGDIFRLAAMLFGVLASIVVFGVLVLWLVLTLL